MHIAQYMKAIIIVLIFLNTGGLKYTDFQMETCLLITHRVLRLISILPVPFY